MSVISAEIRGLLVPLVIGVTGHRDLRPEDCDSLEAAVKRVLHGIQNTYPSTPIVLVSPLAVGADRLVAGVALKLGARLVVPLPMPQHLYEQDFLTPDSLAEFHHYLAQADSQIAIRLLEEEKEVRRPGPARDRQYEAMGKCIARESQILIALWNGHDSGKVGGTGQIVSFQLNGVPCPTGCDLEPPELFPVYHIVTPRISNPTPLGTPFHHEKKYPKSFPSKKKAEEYYHKIFGNMEEFNKEILQGGDRLAANANRSKRDLPFDCDKLPLSGSEALDLERYAVADALAQHYRRKMDLWDKVLHYMVAAAFVCFVVFAHSEEHFSSLLFASLALLAVSYFGIVGWYFPRVKLESKSQDYRAIAEGSRVRFFWRLTGVPESVAENYLGKQRTELDWIRNGLRGWEVETHMAPEAGPFPSKARLQQVRDLWVEAQSQYFHNSAEKLEKKLSRRESLKDICAKLSAFFATITLFALIVTRHFNHTIPSFNEHQPLSLLIIAIDLFLIVAALLHHYIERQAFKQHIKQFDRMEGVFGKARDLIDQKLKLNDFRGIQECLCKLGREALSENGDWVLLRRERPLELPPP